MNGIVGPGNVFDSDSNIMSSCDQPNVPQASS